MPTRSITLRPQNGSSAITAINCGTSSPRLGGTINLSAYPNLTSFTCASNDITALSGTSGLSALKTLTITDNKLTTFPNLSSSIDIETINCFGANSSSLQFTGSFPNLSAFTKLKRYDGIYCGFSGSLPSLSTNTALEFFSCAFSNGALTGNIPDLSACTELVTFYCYRNGHTGSIPNLSANTKLNTFLCQVNSLSGGLPSTLPVAMRFFVCRQNSFTGTIPNLSANVNLVEYDCSVNQLSGTIPSLSANTNLEAFSCAANSAISGNIPNLSTLVRLGKFHCFSTSVSGFAGGSVPNTLGDFQANNCALSQSAVDAILAAFVAANKTTGTRILNLGGAGNAAPTGGQNNANRLTLVSRGWTVTVNG